MVLCKNDSETLVGVISHQKQAISQLLDKRFIQPGELILIQQTITSMKGAYKGLKSIRWVMNCKEMRKDIQRESEAIWGRPWKYIVTGENLKSVEGFDFNEIKSPKTTYSSGNAAFRLKPVDEEIVLGYIGNDLSYENENSDLADDFQAIGLYGMDNIIDYYNNKYAGIPNYKDVVTRRINRPTALRDAIIKHQGTQCRICNDPGFLKPNGSRYCEVHHMIELNNQAPNTLQDWNVIVLCSYCHSQIHYGRVSSERLYPSGWRITIDGVGRDILPLR